MQPKEPKKFFLVLCALTLCLSAPLAAAGRDPVDLFKKTTAAYAAGQFNKCAKLSRNLIAAKPLNLDTALFLQGQCRFYGKDYKGARSSFAGLTKRFKDSPHFILASHRLADCRWELGQYSLAVAEYSRAQKLSKDLLTDPVAGLDRQLRFYKKQKKTKAVKNVLLTLRTRYPDHPILSDYECELSEQVLSFDDLLATAKTLHTIRKWDAALAILDEVRDSVSRQQRFWLAYRIGLILFDMRDRYAAALEMLLAARSNSLDKALNEETWFYASRALGRLDRDDQAIASHLGMLQSHPQGQYAARALFYAGWLEQNQAQCKKAQPLLKRTWQEYPSSKWAAQARWFSAWCHIRDKKWELAITNLAPQIGISRSPNTGRASYWTAVAYQALGKKKLAIAAWKKIIERYPLSWYGLLARVRLGKLVGPPKLPTWTAKQKLVIDSLLARATELNKAGLESLASLILRRGEKSFLARYKGERGLLALFNAYHKADDYNRPWRLAFRYRLGSLRRLPTAFSKYVWQYSYPACARKILKKHVGQDEMFVLFLQAIMRTESGFDSQAHSPADARGLMQMIPPTATKVAAQLGLDYADAKLFESDFNIQTAAWYIGKLYKKFHGQWPLVASAYNGGAPAMMDWCKKNGHLALDQFVETIPFTESRRYAKKVFAAFARYAYLEGKPLPKLTLKLNPDFLDDGIDY
ncbi:MAG: transglycosylase SLT domain-containing protein [Deltaproteobacteria bacterium]|nr:transglycosylase SLT domain-containing protein [Deltaproteobacteria bacterium]